MTDYNFGDITKRSIGGKKILSFVPCAFSLFNGFLDTGFRDCVTIGEIAISCPPLAEVPRSDGGGLMSVNV